MAIAGRHSVVTFHGNSWASPSGVACMATVACSWLHSVVVFSAMMVSHSSLCPLLPSALCVDPLRSTSAIINRNVAPVSGVYAFHDSRKGDATDDDQLHQMSASSCTPCAAEPVVEKAFERLKFGSQVWKCRWSCPKHKDGGDVDAYCTGCCKGCSSK